MDTYSQKLKLIKLSNILVLCRANINLKALLLLPWFIIILLITSNYRISSLSLEVSKYIIFFSFIIQTSSSWWPICLFNVDKEISFIRMCDPDPYKKKYKFHDDLCGYNLYLTFFSFTGPLGILFRNIESNILYFIFMSWIKLPTK